MTLLLERLLVALISFCIVNLLSFYPDKKAFIRS